MIGVGAVGSVVTGGAAVKLIIAGVITTVTGVAMVTAALLIFKISNATMEKPYKK